MSSVPDPWSLASLLSALLLYVSMMSGFGQLLVADMRWRRRGAWPEEPDGLLAAAVVVGLLASLLYFLLEVGAVNRSGLVGMGDPLMISIMADTALGHGTALRVTGFLLLALSWLLAVASLWRPAWRAGGWWRVPAVAAGLCLAASFAVFGHAGELAWSGRLAVMVHVAAVAFWVGSLYPLWRHCRCQPAAEVPDLLRRFGDLARWLLLAMALSGAVLLWQLTGSLTALFGSAYGLGLMLKLSLVMLMVGLGAWHRYRLVPALARPADRESALRKLRVSIAFEGGIAALVLLVTVMVTASFSPPM